MAIKLDYLYAGFGGKTVLDIDGNDHTLSPHLHAVRVGATYLF